MTQSPNLVAVLTRLHKHAATVATPLVTPTQHAAWETYRQHALDVLTRVIAALVAGRITVRDFQRLMTERIQQDHAMATAIARGGVGQLTDADKQAVQQRVRAQLVYLDAWCGDLAADGLGSEALMRNRATLYLDAAQASLNATAATVLGLPTLPAYPGDGSSACLSRCGCFWGIHDLGNGDFDCYWLLSKLEHHCLQCPRRAIVWSPLKVRGGVLQPYLRQGLFA